MAEEKKSEDIPTPPDHFLEIVLATKENTESVGWLITDDEEVIKKEEEIGIPFYSTVSEGANFTHADWKDQACVRQARIEWRDDNRVSWLERHMEMTQGFICVGETPGLFVLGEPTHERVDLTDDQRQFPDFEKMKAYIIPGGCGIIIKKGTWHDFPVSVGPTLTTFIVNTKEVIDALTSMEEPAPMNFGDCYKIRCSDVYDDVTLRFPDPRPFIEKLGLTDTVKRRSIKPKSERADTSSPSVSKEVKTYGNRVKRVEVGNWGRDRSDSVWVVPVLNVESFDPDAYGPSVQPHLNKVQPEVANRGWRDYGNKRGLSRIRSLLRRHQIPCTAVVSSDLVDVPEVANQLRNFQEEDGWEIGAHGANNSNGGHAGLSAEEERTKIATCLDRLGAVFGGNNPTTWLTPGFSVTKQTASLLMDEGVESLLDFVDDDAPFGLIDENSDNTFVEPPVVCIPYSMETNDFSLVLTRGLSPREYAAALESHVLQLADEARDSDKPRVVCFGLHTFVAGAPASVYELDKVLAKLRSASNIKWATAKEVTAAVRHGKGGASREASIPAISRESALPRPSKGVLRLKAEPCETLEVNMNRVGLILIDFQVDFMVPGGFGEQLGNDVSTLRRAIEPTQRLLAAARKAGLTIIHTREGHRRDLSDLTALKAGDGSTIGSKGPYGRILVRGEAGHDIIAELKPLESEIVVDKPGKGAFYQTDLDVILKNTGIDTLLVCGVTTEVCVHTTVREANDRGIRCIVLEDCTASYFPEFHKVGISMISAQGGIFGQVSNAASVIDGLNNAMQSV